MVRTGVVIHKQKFSTMAPRKQTHMLFQNDILIDVACHRYTLNMQVVLNQAQFLPNEPSCTIVTVSFNGLSAVTGTRRSPYESPGESDCKLNLTHRKTSHKTTVRCPHACFYPG
ncbi:hypothetical protein AVEN_208497-1 [Araneus ventricosus]|uniref:Uncharacterized protein n=1 Tax=Araneus ventricosus TaxID=182803 RepID=A0A4Y2E696_ARAVE|nr:hypothetical protein AVEN_208497-1 [Araneus ventricosus]